MTKAKNFDQTKDGFFFTSTQRRKDVEIVTESNPILLFKASRDLCSSALIPIPHIHVDHVL
jgi:hypothetical protein